jgi:hypothetical protein
MKKVKFLQDFQGVETKGVFYRKDAVVEVDDYVAERCVLDGRAEYAEGNGTASFKNSPQFEEAPVYAEAEIFTVDHEEIPIMTSKKNKGRK